MKKCFTEFVRERLAGMNIHYYFFPLEYFLDAQRSLGIQRIELWGGSPHVWVDHLSCSSVTSIKKQLQARRQSIAVFTPEYSSYRYLLCSSDPAVFAKSMDYYLHCIELTKELGATMMCVNITGRFRDENYAAAWGRCVDAVGRLCGAAGQAGISLAVETLSPDQACIMTRLEELKKLFSEVGSKQLKAVIDTVSIGAAGETIEQWFDAFGRDIVHIHFADGRNDGNHLAWGDGCFPLAKYLHQLNERGYEGLISSNISTRRYFTNPVATDKKNYIALSKHFI